MRDVFAYERFPKLPGQNPFRIKGTAYRGHMSYVEEHLPGGAAAMCEAFGDPLLGDFFRQTFLAASFYDLYPLVAAGHVCAKLLHTGFEEFIRLRTRAQAERDVNGVYKMLLKLTSPEGLALRLPRLVGQYLDFGTAEAHRVAPGHVVGVQSGTPRELARWFQLVHEQYVLTVLPMAGARDVLFRGEPPTLRERKDGVELVTMRSDVRWQE